MIGKKKSNEEVEKAEATKKAVEYAKKHHKEDFYNETFEKNVLETIKYYKDGYLEGIKSKKKFL